MSFQTFAGPGLLHTAHVIIAGAALAAAINPEFVMNLTEVTFHDARPFDGYGPGFFRVGGEVYHGALVLHAGGLSSWDGYADAAALTRLADAVDVVLVGTGREVAHVPGDLRTAVEGVGIGLEVMSTPAACRTYNVLMGEGRRVAAAVLPVVGPTGDVSA